MFRAAILALLATAAAAKITSFTPSGDVAASSRLGKRLLEKATVVEPARFLADNQRDVTFLAGYSLRYNGCLSLVQVAQNGQNNNNKNNNGNLLYNQHLVRFGLCPTGSCSAGCTGGGEYVVDLGTFVDLYTEAKLTEQEYTCETIRENCDCENANDDQVCEATCYTNAGHDECVEYEGEGDEFEIQRYLQCQQLEGGNNNNNNNNNQQQYGNYGEYDASTYAGPYYVAPYCSPKDGKSIFLGVFYDASCTAKADVGVYETAVGSELPYASKSLVATECLDCVQANNNNNNNNGNVELKEVCEQSYMSAAKCETNVNVEYKDVSGCDYINNILPKLESASRSTGVKTASGSSGKGAKAFAGIFAFTTVLFAAYSYFLYRKIKRGSVALSSQ